jgi:hypothetical protein
VYGSTDKWLRVFFVSQTLQFVQDIRSIFSISKDLKNGLNLGNEGAVMKLCVGKKSLSFGKILTAKRVLDQALS